LSAARETMTRRWKERDGRTGKQVKEGRSGYGDVVIREDIRQFSSDVRLTRLFHRNLNRELVDIKME
jgi:hypothetical protein